MSTTLPANDPLVTSMREQISAVDLELLALVNKRLELVANLWEYKRARGLPLVAPDRERAMSRYLARENAGPLSAEGLAEFYAFLLDLTKREMDDGG